MWSGPSKVGSDAKTKGTFLLGRSRQLKSHRGVGPKSAQRDGFSICRFSNGFQCFGSGSGQLNRLYKPWHPERLWKIGHVPLCFPFFPFFFQPGAIPAPQLCPSPPKSRTAHARPIHILELVVPPVLISTCNWPPKKSIGKCQKPWKPHIKPKFPYKKLGHIIISPIFSKHDDVYLSTSHMDVS